MVWKQEKYNERILIIGNASSKKYKQIQAVTTSCKRKGNDMKQILLKIAKNWFSRFHNESGMSATRLFVRANISSELVLNAELLG